MKISSKLSQMSIAAFTIFWLGGAQAEIVVIGNQALPVTSLSRDEIYRIYMGKTTFLPNGAKVVPVDQKIGAVSRSQFYKGTLRKSETEMKSHWSRIIFAGQGNPPLQQDDDVAVKKLVAQDTNCLGYIDKSLVDKSIKVVYSQPVFSKSVGNVSTLAMNAMMQKG